MTDYDQAGRVRLTRSYEGDQPAMPSGSPTTGHCRAYDPEAAGIKVETVYRYLKGGSKPGLYTWTSNPYRGTAKAGWRRTGADQLGRVVEVGHFSGAARPSATAAPTLGKTATAYDAEYTTVTDPAGKKRRSRLDGLGRLVRVDEPDSSAALGAVGSPNQKTDYSYNALDNLTRVTQGAETRTFAYDSLSRLTSAANPESGTTAYAYDNNGNLTQRTDARSVVTRYTYDALDRLTRRSYSYTGSDTAVSLATTRVDYAYDTCGSYSRGRPCSVTAKKGQTEVSRTAYNRYDPLGRVLESTQRTGGQTYTMAYAYDRAGNLTSQRYPSDRVVDYVYDGAGRIAGARTGVDSWYAGGTGANAVKYEPHGGVKQLLLGNGPVGAAALQRAAAADPDRAGDEKRSGRPDGDRADSLGGPAATRIRLRRHRKQRQRAEPADPCGSVAESEPGLHLRRAEPVEARPQRAAAGPPGRRATPTTATATAG